MTAHEPHDGAPTGEGRTVVAGTYDHEWQASLVRETLLAEGIGCIVSGGLTGSFRAEAPGRVKILVLEADLERAEAAIARARSEATTIDWSKIDVGAPDPLEGPDDADR